MPRTPEACSLRAECFQDVAETFEIVGQMDGAVMLWRRALEEFERKKDLPSAEFVRRRLAAAEALSTD